MAVWSAALLLLLSAASLLAYRSLARPSDPLRRFRARVELRSELESWAERAVSLLAADPTPLADSVHDPVWRYMTIVPRSGIDCSLTDAGSLPGANPLIDIEGEPLPAIEQFLLDHGVGDAPVRTVTALLSARRRAGQPTLASELEGMLGGSYRALRPAFARGPMLNVNLASPSLIGAVLAQRLPSARAAEILRAILRVRETIEIDQAILERLLRGATSYGPLRLGTRTRVWKLTLSNRSATLTKTVVSVPSGPLRRFCEIEDRFEPTPSPRATAGEATPR